MADPIHIGTATTLAAVPAASCSNGDIAYIWLNSYNVKMVYDDSATNATATSDGLTTPYYIRPSDYGVAGVWIEDVGAEEKLRLNAAQTITGKLISTNWSTTVGSQLDLDAGTIKLGGSSAPKFSVTAAGILTATEAIITGAISAATIDIGGDDATSFHVDINGNIWSGAATYNIATNPFAVSSAGLLRAVSGSIAGLTLDAAEGLYAGAAATRVQIKPGAAGVGGIWTGATAVGDAKNYLNVSGAGKLAAGNIAWDTSGNITMAGAFTSTATITGGTIQTSATANTGIKLNSTALYGYNGTVQTIDLKTDGSGWFGLTGAKAIEWTTAGAVTIAGYTANATAFYSGADAARIQLDTTAGIWCGATAFGSAPFRVNLAGDLVATSATITGAITATSGSFAGAIAASTIDIGGDDATSFHVDINGGIWSGAAIADKAAAPFRVSNAGALVATSISIGDANSYLTFSGGAMAIKMASGETFDLYGSMNIYDGGDITLNPSDTDPALIKWGAIHNLGAASTTARGLCIWPTTADQDYFSVGYDPINDTLQPYSYIRVVADNYIDLYAYTDLQNYSRIYVYSSDSLDPMIKLMVGSIGGAKEITFSNDTSSFYPSPNGNIYLGTSSNRWKDLYLSGKLYIDDYILMADNKWIGLGAAAGRIEFDNQATDEINFLDCNVGIGTSTPSTYADLTLEGGALCLKERATPTADTNYGKIYTKTNDKLYFQNGAGVEKEIAFVP